jgi:hypothetical protein
MMVKPVTSDDSILLYSAQDEDGSGDYVSLTIKDGYVEFMYNLGSGMHGMIQYFINSQIICLYIICSALASHRCGCVLHAHFPKSHLVWTNLNMENIEE